MSKSYFSRRKFLSASILSTVGLTAIPNLSFGGTALIADSSKIRLGFIGVGRQAMGLLGNMMKNPLVDVVAAADVYEIKLERFKARVAKHYTDDNRKAPSMNVYADYKQLLANPEVDAVVIASPDHWHAMMAIDACHAGKDIYLEKPLTFTIHEGQELVKAVRSKGTVLAVGSMQRSGANFQHAARMVQKGMLGEIKQVLVSVGTPPHPKPYDLPKQPIPAGLDWKTWTGPLPDIHYNEELNPPITLNPEQNEKVWGAWRWYKETGGGLMTDWGAHMIDIAQWGLGMDRNCLTEVIPATNSKPLTYIYANGIEMQITSYDGNRAGVKFIGEKGWITVSRGQYDTSVSACERTFEKDEFGFGAHHVDFIDSVVMRKDPIVPVEVGHNTCSICTIGNIAHELGRPLKWDPITQIFKDDWEANTKLHYAYQQGYSLG
ncbi:putative dehydrogenase [Algoriphagus ratkowskyi]|uniref:Gfo/Idh/MocA family oxidoreductase n=1 Tax=Algoriphagus ratkowskyi TaxID=57028 RepID=A0A2W7RYH7_9BACT|nr:Gfo/Idh/MocA family oxidoreductase [Algoriphagus ratkowskyi]PZX59639.1 putative dehydrogenase [Algoriphagus ratkowskyi]TXD78639.1 Gfo/Idh/MocA family oxidoreductase [Algoriphagus ratkowskyi]